MANQLQIKIFSLDTPEGDANKSDADSTTRARSAAPASSRCLTPEPPTARRDIPQASQVPASSPQPPEPPEELLRDLIEKCEATQDEQGIEKGQKRLREDEAEDEPPTKRDRTKRDGLGEELHELDAAARASTANASEHRYDTTSVTPPALQDNQGPSMKLPVRPFRRVPSRLADDGTCAAEETAPFGSSDTSCRPPEDMSKAPEP